MLERVTLIGTYAFGSRTLMMEVELVGGIQDIRVHALEGCSSLERIVIPYEAFVIETGAYHNCCSLKDGTITPTSGGQVVIASGV